MTTSELNTTNSTNTTSQLLTTCTGVRIAWKYIRGFTVDDNYGDRAVIVQYQSTHDEVLYGVYDSAEEAAAVIETLYEQWDEYLKCEMK